MKKSLGNKIWILIEKITYKILLYIFKIIKKKPSDEIFASFMQFVKFGIVGISNTIISYIIYVVSLLLFRIMGLLSNIDYLAAQAAAFILSVIWSFYWNNKIVFVMHEREKRSIWLSLIKTFISYSFTGLFLNTVLIIFWVNVMHVSEFVAPIINLLISVPINFVINKFWAFRGKIENESR